MSNDVVIRAESISKRYRISHQVKQTTLCETLPDLARRALQRLRGEATRTREDFWALKDINFEIKRGEVVGIIGRNGAGKSTLLKILSRITAPTTGRITLKGRVASLLEVGTGFHPELTGRDNIYLNGAILGMSRAEIRQKFDEIVAFAEVERFIDTPVKRYSSGMYVRLAFSVAAHLEPEILIVDEVLAVGDAAFQKKCLGKINQVSREEGRTVLLVSHHLSTVQQLCSRVIVLQNGLLQSAGTTAEGIAAYTKVATQTTETVEGRKLGDELELVHFNLSPSPLQVFTDADYRLELKAQRTCGIYELCLLVQNSFGQRVAIVDLRAQDGKYPLAAGQVLSLHGRLSSLALLPGTYHVGFFIRADHHMQDHLALRTIEVMPPHGYNRLTNYQPEHLGTLAINANVEAEITGPFERIDN
jgi:lipopolysaccharide transport system ATP-binding protein